MASHDLQTKLYRSICNNSNDHEVLELCSEAAEGSLHYCTIHNSTVLHLACSFQKFELANKLFDSLNEDLLNIRLKRINAWGNTVLHEASTSNEGLELVRKLLKAVPELLQARNRWGETAIFRATRYGMREVFEFLAQQVDNLCESNEELDRLLFFQRDDGNTILHMAIIARNYGMAHDIADKYPDLCNVQTQNKWTALQLLADSPESFKSGAMLSFLRRVLYSRVSTNEQGCMEDSGMIQKFLAFVIGKSLWRSPLIIEEVRMMKQKHRDAVELAKILIPFDDSWKDTHEPSADVPLFIEETQPTLRSVNESQEDLIQIKIIKLLRKAAKDETSDEGASSSPETPLFIAARKGCIEIVEAILERFPQAVHYLNHNQENLLHVAIKTRNLEVFDYVERFSPSEGLLASLDNQQNSILHMVGFSREAPPGTEIRNPVNQLAEDLLLLEKLETMCPSHLVNFRNNQWKTAHELFAQNKEKLRNEAKDWVKRTVEHTTVLIILIATIAFTGAYTIPGGPDQTTGYPLLRRSSIFLVFTVSDALSVGFALTALLIFLRIFISSYRFQEFRRSLPQRLLLGYTLVLLSGIMMTLAFAATIVFMVHTKQRRAKIALYVVTFVPVCVALVNYIPIYVRLVLIAWSRFKEIGKILPRFACTSRSSSFKSRGDHQA